MKKLPGNHINPLDYQDLLLKIGKQLSKFSPNFSLFKDIEKLNKCPMLQYFIYIVLIILRDE